MFTRCLIIGYGFSAHAIAEHLKQSAHMGYFSLAVTTRTEDKAKKLKKDGLEVILFDGEKPSAQLAEILPTVTHIIMSAAPDEHGDPFLRQHGSDLAKAENLQWVGYLSTVGIYGDHQGAWVSEETEPRPVSQRSTQRMRAEKAWEDALEETSARLAIFRLSGIYGPGRSPLEQVKNGTARRIIKPGQVFNRIHVTDIGRFVAEAAQRKTQGTFNLTDDEPAPPQDVVTFAAKLLGMEPPPEVPFEEADLSPMGRSFYGEVKRVSNQKIKQTLGMVMQYPTYKEGLQALVE